MRHMITSLTVVLVARAADLLVPYAEYIQAPSSRILKPQAVYQSFGSVINPQYLCNDHRGPGAIFTGISSVTYDFGRNIQGIVTLDVESAFSPDALLGVTFSESSLWVSNKSCDATADEGLDAPLRFAVGDRAGVYSAPPQQQRGAFRYLTIVSNSTGTIVLKGLTVNYTAAPVQNLRGYTGYFHSDDELLNQIWYAGAYTVQLATINPAYGNALTVLVTWPPGVQSEYNTWYSNFSITNGTSALTDGGKRDRLVWAADMTIALESAMVSTYDLISVRNSLVALLTLQAADGRLPYASHPFPDQESFTYHLHSLINFAALYRYSGDDNWIAAYWNQFKAGMSWALRRVDETGLAFVASVASADWLRSGMGGHNIEANAILYSALQEGSLLAGVMQDASTQATWKNAAASLKSAANSLLWDDHIGLFRDNETAALYPQDGNSWAVRSGLVQSPAQSDRISSNLRSRWGPYGAPAPEAGHITISPFIGGFELQAHFLSGHAQTALDLMRLQWGFMLKDLRMTGSTFVEGYSTGGSLQYAPYNNAARLSHAHAWSTGPTSSLSVYAAGIQVAAGGATWQIAPQPGDLRFVDAGFSTALGMYSITLTRTETGAYTQFTFTTPFGTVGEVSLPGLTGKLISNFGTTALLVNGAASGLRGGTWVLE